MSGRQDQVTAKYHRNRRQMLAAEAAKLAVARCYDCGREHEDGGQQIDPMGHPDRVWVCGSCYADNWAD